MHHLTKAAWCVVLAGFLWSASAAFAAVADRINDPVKINLTVTPAVTARGKQVEVKLTINVADGWHIYGSRTGQTGEQPLDIRLELPRDVTPAGEWVSPEPEILGEPYNMQIYQGEQSFTRKLNITTAEEQVTIKAVVLYQACTFETCAMPTQKDAAVTLAVEPPRGK